MHQHASSKTQRYFPLRHPCQGEDAAGGFLCIKPPRIRTGSFQVHDKSHNSNHDIVNAGITFEGKVRLVVYRVFGACTHQTSQDNHATSHAGITFEGKVQLVAFCVFESCVGIFWPSMMKLRSQYLPEESRSTIINFFRIPLNMFVCIMLYNVSPSGNLCNACLGIATQNICNIGQL